MKNLKTWCLFICLVATGGLRQCLADGCACSQEQKVVFRLRGVATMAGSATINVSWGNRTESTTLITSNTIAPPNETNPHYHAINYQCVQWAREIVITNFLDQPVLIQYIHNTTNNDLSTYTEFKDVQGDNPVTYFARPTLECLKVFYQREGEDWVPSTPHFYFDKVLRLKGVVGNDDSKIGATKGVQAGGGEPQPDNPKLMDAEEIGDLLDRCPGAGVSSASLAAAEVSSTTLAEATTTSSSKGLAAAAQRGGLTMRQPRSRHPQSSGSTVNSVTGKSASKLGTASADSTTQFSAQSTTASNGYSIVEKIGRLRWEMSLGSAGKTLTLGRLNYQADVLDGTAYSPGRLRLAAGGDPSMVLSDANGYLRQVEMQASLVDIQGIPNGIQIAVYPRAQAGVLDPGTGLFPVSGTPTLSWRVENPDATPMGRVLFTKTQGTNSEVHQAEWQGINGVAGTMTITRYGGKWKEVREYALAANNTQRIETISQYKQNTLQHKAREVYQEFYNWANPGDVFEAIVQRVEDPDGRALTTTYQYCDQAPLPGGLLYQATYPDGYSERIPNRYSGNDFSWVVSNGGELRREQPFKDNAPGSSAGRVTETAYSVLSDHLVLEATTSTVNGQMVGYRETYHDSSHPGVRGKITFDVADDSSGQFTHEEEWVDWNTRKPVFILDRTGTTRYFSYEDGNWDEASETFSTSFFDPPQAFKTTVIHGSDATQHGVAGKTTLEVTVEDRFGHAVLEESYVSDGTFVIVPSALIDRKTHTYTDGRLTATHWNGRLIYEAGYNLESKVQWEEDESGRRTEYTYDEMKRVYQKTIRGRGGDADQVITYDYDVLGNRTSETRSAGSLSVQARWIFNLAGEMVAAVGTEGLTNLVSVSYTNGFKVVTQTLPTQATSVTSFFKDRQARSVTGTAVEDEYYDQFIATWTQGSFREGASVYLDSALTQLKQARIVNWLGNEILVRTPRFKGTGNRDRYTDYDADADGQTRQLVVEVTETGRATQLFTYDELAVLTAQGLDLNNNGVLDVASTEPIATFDQQFTTTNGFWEQVATVQRYQQDNVATNTLLQRTRTVVPALLSANLIASNVVERAGGGIVIGTVSLDRSTGERTTTVNDQELGQVTTRIERDGRIRSETQPGISTPRRYSYTALGEPETVSDPVTGNVTNAYNSVTRRLASVTDSLGRHTTYDYYPSGVDNAGHVRGLQDATGKWTYFAYTAAGQLHREWGVNAYPIQYSYDDAGRMTNMMTFRTVPGAVNWTSSTWPNPNAGDVTQWIYDGPSGILERKIYADAGAGAKAVVYTYDSGDFPDAKTNGRGQVADYTIDSAGRMRGVSYSDGTPSVTLDYDRAGRLRSVSDGSGTRSVTWTDRDQAMDETYTTGMLAGMSVDRTYDARFRIGRIELKQNGATQTRQRFSYDGISWLDYIANESPDGATLLHKFDYTFKPGTPFVQSVDFSRGTTTVMTQSYTRDSLGRRAGSSATLAGGGTMNSVNYQFDTLDRRFEANLADGTKWDYGYNDRGEVTSGRKKLASGAFAGGKQFEYAFDDIGNRAVARFGGDSAGSNLREASYGQANPLNQLSTRAVPGSAWLTGEAPTNLTLQGVADGLPFTVERQAGDQFFGEATLENGTAAAFARVTVAGTDGGTLKDTQTGHRFAARNPETYLYDADGNLTQDGRWTYTWDAENRLKSVTARTGIPDAAKGKLDFLYDSQGRRVQKIVSTWNGTQYVAQSTNRFVYEGWNLVAILDSQSSILQSFTWGLDLSGTTQGAGGVGGLLAMTVHRGASAGTYFYGYDGNGNVMAFANAADGAAAAQYEYGPFGEVIRASGPMAKSNPFRFSTKYQDDESDFLYYGYRYYNPSTGRWLSRDPLEEHGAANLSSFVGNDAVNRVDLLGLVDRSTFVTKSFINGIRNIGSLKGRAGWNPALEPVPVRGSVPDLPFLRQLIVLPLFDPMDYLSGQLADVRLKAFVRAAKGQDPFTQFPLTADEDGEYRLYTRVTIEASVCNSTPTVEVSRADMDGGQEIGPISGTITMPPPDIRKTTDSVMVHWKGWGHPNPIVEPGMQLVARRSSVNIWHEVTVKVSCKAGKASFKIEKFAVSSFPSHRLWQDGVLKFDLTQGAISELWQADPNNPTFVRPRP